VIWTRPPTPLSGQLPPIPLCPCVKIAAREAPTFHVQTLDLQLAGILRQLPGRGRFYRWWVPVAATCSPACEELVRVVTCDCRPLRVEGCGRQSGIPTGQLLSSDMPQSSSTRPNLEVRSGDGRTGTAVFVSGYSPLPADSFGGLRDTLLFRKKSGCLTLRAYVRE
jgi:hypothetical protein